MNSQQKSRPVLVTILIFLIFLLGLGAAVSGALLVIAPDGHLLQMPLSNLANAPFRSFLIPGLLLTLFIGIFPLLDAYSLWKQPSWDWPRTINPFRTMHWSWAGSLAAGIAVIIWILVQIQWVQTGFLHILYLIWGVTILVIAFLPTVRDYYHLPV